MTYQMNIRPKYRVSTNYKNQSCQDLWLQSARLINFRLSCDFLCLEINIKFYLMYIFCLVSRSIPHIAGFAEKT